MKVVFTSLFREGMGGGAGRVAHELAHHFADVHDTVMICPADQTGLRKTEGDLNLFGVRSAGDDEFHMPNLTAKTVRAIFDFLNDYHPDVIHAHDPALLGLIGQVWARMNLVPFVHTAHVLPSRALDFGTTEALNIKLLQSSFSESVTRRALSDFYENCDAVVALNQSALESMRSFGYKGKLYIIPNGRNLQHYQDCQFADIDAQEKVITFIGFISERKNQAYLLEVLRHLPENYTMQFVGKALKQEYKEKLQGYIAQHDLHNAEFVGQVEHERIPEYLEKAHVFPSASKMEVQSLVVIEALASGTPVVGLSNETIDELVNTQVGCWLEKETPPEEFADRIRDICQLEQGEYEEMCRQAQKRVKHLDWSEIVEQTTAAYQEIREAKPSRSEEKSDLLTGLVTFFSSGEVESFLTSRILEAREKNQRQRGLWKQINIPAKLRALRRVQGSTWLISGATIVISVLGYLFMKGRSKDS
jgi:glycosyltransferase involved in cell wall biosynthesis